MPSCDMALIEKKNKTKCKETRQQTGLRFLVICVWLMELVSWAKLHFGFIVMGFECCKSV